MWATAHKIVGHDLRGGFSCKRSHRRRRDGTFREAAQVHNGAEPHRALVGTIDPSVDQVDHSRFPQPPKENCVLRKSQTSTTSFAGRQIVRPLDLVVVIVVLCCFFSLCVVFKEQKMMPITRVFVFTVDVTLS